MTRSTDDEQEREGPLDGIRVLECAVFHAGPGGSAILGDLGAEVIKIETPAGDPERHWTDVGGIDFSLPNGESAMFEGSNRNKRGICLDMKKEKGRAIFDRLARRADVFVTNLRKSTKVKLGLDYPTLARLNPKIIHASVSGYGLEGPMSDLGAFDPLGQARSGMMFVTGSPEPKMLHLGLLDQATAITLSHAILTALFVRERKGIGQEVHVSLYSTALWVQYANLMLSSILSADPSVTTTRFNHSQMRNVFCCRKAGGYWEHHPERVLASFREPPGTDLLNDPHSRRAGRPINFVELMEIFDRSLPPGRARMDGDLSETRTLFCSVQHQRGHERPQALANGYVVPFDHPTRGASSSRATRCTSAPAAPVLEARLPPWVSTPTRSFARSAWAIPRSMR
jgi:formyl-CoA transferase